MARIDIDHLSEEELIDLNHRIVSRLRFLREMRSHRQMLDFRIGEKVRFHPPDRPEITGTLTRYNKKSVTVVAESGQRWNGHPGLLFKVTEATGGARWPTSSGRICHSVPAARKQNQFMSHIYGKKAKTHAAREGRKEAPTTGVHDHFYQWKAKLLCSDRSFR